MKEKCITLVIGILIGAILASGGFLIYNKTNSKNKVPNFTEKGQMKQMDENGTRGNFEKGQKQKEGTDTNTPNTQIPNGMEKPDGEPPAIPGETSTNSET